MAVIVSFAGKVLPVIDMPTWSPAVVVRPVTLVEPAVVVPVVGMPGVVGPCDVAFTVAESSGTAVVASLDVIQLPGGERCVLKPRQRQ